MNWTSKHRRLAATVLTWLAAGAGAGAADLKRGEALYEICGSCHGDQGQGEERMAVPAIAGQDSAYLLRQLNHFAQGLRSGPPESPAGQMVAIMKFAASQKDWDDIIGFVATLPPPAPKAAALSLKDRQRGEALYAGCAACHGTRAEGNPALSAPALAHLQDWYVAAQLKNFRSGVRGGGDAAGAQMRAAASVLTSDTDVNAVARYIGTRTGSAAPRNQ
jgi:cytochrome c oxidase subunit II